MNSLIKSMSSDQKTISIKLKAKVAKDDTCNGCYFEDTGACINNKCCESERIDGKNIIWVEIKRKAKS